MAQNYSNHIRFNPLHHFVITPLTLVILIWSIIRFVKAGVGADSGEFLTVLIALSLILAAFIARIYGLKLQDRLIRLEMRQRYFELTGKSFSEKEAQLNLKQIIALRFAGNEELLALIDRTISDSLPSKAIKQTVRNWQADDNRI